MALALLGAWFFYSKPGIYPKSIRWTLFSLRALLLFIILALLLNPLIRNIRQAMLPPIAVLLIDNSQSIALGTPKDSLSTFQKNLKELKGKLESSGVQVVLSGLDKDISSDSALLFSGRQSNLDAALKRIQDQFDNQNLTQVIVASDGIFNLGADPSQIEYPFSVSTIRLGNPQPNKDLLIARIRNNKVAFLGNTFPIQVQVKGRKLAGNQVVVEISENNQILQSKTATLGMNELVDLDFQLKATTKGIQQYQVSVRPVEGELTLLNNKRSTYIEVVEGKQKILLVAAAPHPDIKAIRSALEPIDQLEVTTVIGSKDEWKPGSYNLIILHQLPDRWGTFGPQVVQALKGNTPIWIFAGSSTDLNRLRLETAEWLKIQGYGNGLDEVSGVINPDFQRFTFEDSWRKIIETLPPLPSPVSSYSFKFPAEIVLQQKLGRATTQTPMLSVDVNSQPKKAIFWGEGIWIWRLNEFALNQNFTAVDNLIQKMTQLLLSSDKKQRLKVHLAQSEMMLGEQANFICETYNQLFEPIFNQKITLDIRNSEGRKFQYSFFNSPTNSTFTGESLPAGAYRFTASSQINGKTETDAGEFVVKAFDLESQELEANHTLLKNLATKNNGQSVGISQMALLGTDLNDLAKPLIEFTDWDENILSKTWLLLLIIAIASVEWFIRKWNGTL